MSQEAVVARKIPYTVEVMEGKTYYWCACGRSAKQPYCDGAHQGTGIEPRGFTAEKTGALHLCGCKRTANAPKCDGSHVML